jgi:putative ATP-dependent endonuclease of OLD family
MGPGNTKLDENKDDYGFLQRFLDVTKANMFFAKGVILVEGYAEALLIPVIAEKIGRSLTAHGVSVVNVGSSAFLRFGRIFLRNDEKRMATKTAIITDYDFRPKAFSRARNPEKRKRAFVEDAFSPTDIESKLLSRTISEQNVRTFFSPKWTLEYCIALSKYHRKAFYKAVLEGWAEKKRAHGTKSTKSIDSKIEKIEEAFQNWTEDPDVIAYSIYNDIILNRQLSKAAIAQYFAIELQVGEYEIKEDDENLKYIIDAIKFVTDGSHD